MKLNPVRHIDRVLRLLLLALLVCLALAALLVLSKGRPQPLPVPESVLRTQTVKVDQASATPGGALVQSPLFWESRRPYVALDPDAIEEAAAEVQPSGPTLVDELQLVGIIGAGVEYTGVLIRHKERRLRLEFGEELEGWALTNLSPTEATFSGVDRNGEPVERTLTLNRHRPDASGDNQDDRQRFAPARSRNVSTASDESEAGRAVTNQADTGVDEDTQPTSQENQAQDDPRGLDE